MKKPFKQMEPGDEILVDLGRKKEHGVLLESHDKGILLLKLENGYNIGFKKEDISEITLVRKGKREPVQDALKLDGAKPVIDFYLTGGTISSKLDSSTGGVKWLIEGKELFSVYPEIFERADVRVKSPFLKSSENMDSKDWIRLAKLIGTSLQDSAVQGVIVSHGTDFLHYTASALSFMLGTLNKPVVLTYAQRSSDRGSSDSRLNLLCAAQAALSDIAEVMIVGHATINDTYCYALRGTKVRKMHTSRRDAFRPINTKPLAKIWPNTIEIMALYHKRNKEKVVVDAVFEDKVALVTFYPGQDPKILDYYRKNFKGIVIEMSGLGHIISEGKNNWLPSLKKVIEKGLYVFGAPQTLYGRLNPYVYSPGRKLLDAGVVYLEDMLPETAFVKLGWVLAHKEFRGSVATARKMKENLAGEFNERLGTDFL